MKLWILIVMVLFSVFSAYAAEKENTIEEIIPDNTLTKEEDEFLLTLPRTHYTNKDITLENGQNLQDYIDANPEVFPEKNTRDKRSENDRN